MNTWQKIRQKALVLITGLALSCSAFAQTVTYFHNDISGTPLLATDAAGNVLWKENNRPYGDKLNAQPASADNKIGYHGKPFDDNTGLSYMGARYYDPVLGRFTGVDPVGFVEGNLHSFNRYAYANNNPYKFVDPDGRYAEAPFEALSITIGIGSLVSNYQQGNWMAAAADAVGIAADAVGVILPGVPGVVGLGIQASRQIPDVATSAAKGVATGAESAVNGLKLNKSLASQAQMGEVGTTMAGAGARVPFRDAARVAKEHGGNAADWVKRSSSSHTARDGATFETHWVENVRTGQRVEFKTKFPGGD